MTDGATVHLRRHGNGQGSRIALSHGNGLAIDAYFPFWRILAERHDLILFDVRNHGQNPLHGPDGHDYPTVAEDMETIWHGIAEHFGPRPIVGAFHSLSAIAALMHALERPERWRALVLFDPPFFPPDNHRLVPLEVAHMEEMTARASRRPRRYARISGLAGQFAMRAEFSGWRPGCHELVARATLRHDRQADDWMLACPRELEARMYETNIDGTLWPRIEHLTTPLKLICGDPELAAPLPSALIGKAMGEELPIAYEAIAGTTHFLQIEQPEACVAALETFLDALPDGSA
jgi:pimeloyl-ACP methyl ester carboxylesterase